MNAQPSPNIHRRLMRVINRVAAEHGRRHAEILRQQLVVSCQDLLRTGDAMSEADVSALADHLDNTAPSRGSITGETT